MKDDDEMLERLEISPATWEALPENIQMEFRALYEQSGKVRLMVVALRDLIEWVESGTIMGVARTKDEVLDAAQAALEEGRAD